jgi:flavin-dependent dehydrogenase
MIDKIIDEYLCSKSYKILDKHGNVARYSLGLKDTFYKDKIVAIGDAVSTINPLGGEGIQYAMENGKFAADYIDRFLRNKKVNFKEYQKKWRKKYYLKWSICEEATKRMYTKYDDEKIESRVDYYHKNTDVNGLIDVLFNFKLNRVIPTLMKSFFYKLLPKFVRK